MILLRERVGDQIRRLSNPVIPNLMAIWSDAKPEHGLPSSPAVLSALRAECEDELMELVPHRDGEFLYVRYGPAVARHAGFDMTGKTTAAFNSRTGLFFKEKYATAITTRQAIYTVHRAEHATDIFSWERLILPLTHPENDFCLVVYNQPLQRRDELLDTILDATADGVLALATIEPERGGRTDLAIVLANQAMGRIAGHGDPGTLIGMSLERLLVRSRDLDLVVLCREAAETGVARTVECENPFADDGGYVGIAITPVGDGVSLTVHDLTARKAQERAEERSRLAAEEANRAKSAFLARMSHELRTPLNAIIGFSSLLELHGDNPPPNPIKREVGHIKTAAEHLLGLIEDVLEISKLDVGEERLRIESLNLSEIVDETLAFARSIAADKRITVDGPLEGQVLGWVMADSLRLRQVLINLLSNAIKYNVSGGNVSVSVERPDDGAIRVLVRDSGIGIPPDRMAHVFEPFDRLGRENSRIEGTGLGLALSKMLIEVMGGRIAVESTLGEGSLFWIEIPAAQVEEPLPRSEHARKPSLVSAVGDRPINMFRQKVVLYVEDNPANMMLMRQVAEKVSGVRLLEARTAEIGLAVLEQQRPDILFVDINLPGMDGFGLLERIRDKSELHDIRTIAISASAMKEDVERGLAAGFEAYLTKPIDLEELLKILRD